MIKIKINKNKAGLSLGITFAVFHSAWLILSLVGIGHLWFRWMHELHFMKANYEMLSFDLLTALLGIGATFVTGYLVGWVFGLVWEKVGN